MGMHSSFVAIYTDSAEFVPSLQSFNFCITKTTMGAVLILLHANKRIKLKIGLGFRTGCITKTRVNCIIKFQCSSVPDFNSKNELTFHLIDTNDAMVTKCYQ